MLPKNIKVLEKLGTLARKGWLFVQINKPSVLTGLAMGGAVILTGSASKSAVETYKIKDDIKDLDFVDKAREVVPLWVETALILLFVEILIFGANRENMNRIAALAGACSLNEQNLKEYKEKAEEIVGKKKVGEIEDAIVSEYAKNEGMNDFVYDTGKGTTLFKDLSTGRKFYSDKNVIEAAVNELNTELNMHGPASDNPTLYFVTKNDFYRRIGLEEIDGGDELGWNSFSGNLIWIDYKSKMLPDNKNYITYIRFENIAPTFDDDYAVYNK